MLKASALKPLRKLFIILISKKRLLFLRCGNMQAFMSRMAKHQNCKKRQKPDWNTSLRSMCWRLGTSLLKTCNRKGSRFYDLYVNTLNNYVAEYTNKGIRIIATVDMKKGGNGKKEEAANTITKGQVQNQALRKMIKIFLQCLWLVWREAEGLPVSEPYVKSHLGHQHILTPWDMTDADKK